MAKKINIIANLIDKQFKRQMQDLQNKNYNVNVNVKNENISNTSNHVRQLSKNVESANTAFGKLKNKITDTFSAGRVSMTMFLAALNEIRKAGKNAKQTIEEINQSITDLAIATNMSREATAELVKEYNNYAKELKSTTTQVTQAADDYLRAGKSMSETNELIKDSIMLSKLGQIESSAATEDLLATMNGFDMSIEEVGKSLDAMVAIDMKAATSSGDIATALKYCASSADVAGVSFNKLASMIGTVQDKTQQSAETVGTFMNTLLSRYRNVKIGQFVDDNGEDISDVESILGSFNTKLRDSNQEFRDFEIVIDEVAKSWDSYSSVQQAAIAKAFSGTRQQNRFFALMENYNKVLELTEVAANSAGTAVEKFNNSYVNSLEAQRNTLQASFESMVINSDMDEVYSSILEATTALVDFMNETNALKGVMTGLTVSGGIKFFLAMRSGINEAYISLNKFANALKIVKQTNISTAEFDKLLLLSNGLSQSQMRLLLSSKNLTLAQKEQLLVNSGLSSEEAKLQLETWGLTTAQNGLTVATTTVGNAFKGLFATMAANPFMLITMAVSAGVMAYQSYNQKLEETRQKNIEASETAIEHANSLRELYSEYARLSSIQDKTSSEEESFKSVIEDVTKALGDKAKVLEGLTAGTNEYAEALKNVTKEELQSASVNATIGRKSAEEELQGKIWSEWSGSLVTIDSNSKGQALSDEAEKAVGIVSDALKEFETINRTWNNLSWDISSDNPEEALNYYNALIKAREQLVLSSETDETLLDTEIYSDLNNAISTMSESLDSYIEKRYEEEKLNYMASNGIPQTVEEYNAMQKALINTSGASQILQDKFNSLLMTDFPGLANEINTVAEAQDNLINTTQNEIANISTITSSISQIATQLEPQFKKLGEAYKAIFTDDGFTLDDVDNSMLEGLRKSFAEIEEEVGVAFDATQLDSFFETLTDGSGTSEEQAQRVQQAFNDLATAYFYSTDTLAQLNDETADAIQKQLEEMGVVNAQTIVADALTAKTEELIVQKEYLAQTGKMLSDVSDEEATAFILEQIEAGNCGEALALLQLKKVLVNSTTINTSADVQQIMNLASAAGMGAEVLTQLANAKSILNTVENGGTVSLSSYEKALSDVESAKQTMLDWKPVEVKFDGSKSANSASKAGKQAGDAYVEAYEEEVKKLDDLKEQGKITEKQYLDYLRKLYEKYFKNISKYAEKFAQEQSKYLSGMKSLYESALSGITGLIGKQIDAYNDQKDAAISALEAQKEAASDAYEAQISAIEERIKAKQKEIDAIREENEAIKNQIDLEQLQYEAEQLRNNKTIRQYSEGKGIAYTVDSSAIRKKEQEIDEKKDDIRISEIEKSIDLLEEEKNAIEEMIDKSNSYFDGLIEQTRAYYDSLVEGLSNYKSRWEELAEIEENAKLMATLKELGITTEDVLGMSEEAFNKFKVEYTSILADIYSGNDTMTNALADSLGTTTDKLGSYIGSTQEYINSLSGSADALQPVAEALSNTSEGMDNLNTSASNASANTSQIATDMGTLNTNTTGLSGNLDGINDALSSVPDVSETVSNIAKSYEELGKSLSNGEESTSTDIKLDNINTELTEIPIDASTKMDSIANAYEKLNNSVQSEEGIVLSDNLNNINDALSGMPEAEKFDAIATSFTNLGKAIKDISTALGVGEEGTVGGLVGALQSISNISLGGDDNSGIIGQFNKLKIAVDEVSTAITSGGSGISNGDASTSSSPSMSAGNGNEGSSGLIGSIDKLQQTTETALGSGESKDGDGSGVIGKFSALKSAVDEVTKAIGMSEDNNIDQGASDLISAIQLETNVANEKLPEQISLFGELLGVINECVASLNAMSSAIENVSIKGSGGSIIKGKYATGTTSAKKGLSIVGEKAPEVIQDNDGNVSLVSKPTLINMEGGEKVYNGDETEKLLQLNLSSNEVILRKKDGGILSDNPLWMKMIENAPNLSFNYAMPDYSNMSNMVVKESRPVEVTQHINVNMPNVTNETGFRNFEKEMQCLQLKALQRSYRR